MILSEIWLDRFQKMLIIYSSNCCIYHSQILGLGLSFDTPKAGLLHYAVFFYIACGAAYIKELA